MKLVKLWGGLGNQLFQYSFGEFLKKETNEEVIYVNAFGVCDLSNSPLSAFNCVSSQNSTGKYFSNYFNGSYRFNRKVLQFLPFLSNKIIVENLREAFSKNSLQYILFDGYWQDLSFIDFNRYALQALFTLRDETILTQTDFSDLIYNCDAAVSIHIRRTDFLASSYHNVLTLDYYQKAMHQIVERVQNPIFFIFSDDIFWAKNNFSFNKNTYFVSSQNSHQSMLTDFNLMSICKHHIIANSTFSWWPAWLNDHEDKIVIAPKNWYKFNNELANRILPKEWIML